MKLIPNKKKFKKYHKRGVSNNITNVIDLFSKYKNIRIKCLENANLTVNQIESFKNSIKKFMKKKGKFNIFLLADLPITKKPLEVRMGKGKGNVDSWVCKVRPGSTLCEIKTIYKSLGLKALYSTQYRLPLKTKILKN